MLTVAPRPAAPAEPSIRARTVLAASTRVGRCAVRRPGAPATPLPVGAVLVAERIDSSMLSLVVDASAVVLEAPPERTGLEGGHLGALLHDLDIPLVCGATGAMQRFVEGQHVTVSTRAAQAEVRATAVS